MEVKQSNRRRGAVSAETYSEEDANSFVKKVGKLAASQFPIDPISLKCLLEMNALEVLSGRAAAWPSGDHIVRMLLLLEGWPGLQL